MGTQNTNKNYEIGMDMIKARAVLKDYISMDPNNQQEYQQTDEYKKAMEFYKCLNGRIEREVIIGKEIVEKLDLKTKRNNVLNKL